MFAKQRSKELAVGYEAVDSLIKSYYLLIFILPHRIFINILSM
jgi:hypothetical protein